MVGALDGIRILEWAMMINGPAAGYMLGDLGAEVIKIEDPVRGDMSRGMHSVFDAAMTLPGGSTVQYETANRNHKSVTLDLKKEKGKEVLYRLVEKSDVFLTNFRKGIAERLQVDYHTLRRHNPRLIYALTSMYGTRGPWQEKRGFDPVAQALSGAMYIFGDRDQSEPSLATAAIFDMMGASLLAYGILAALIARDKTGEGQELEASMLGSAVHLQALAINAQLWRGRPTMRHTRTGSKNPVANFYRCADGKWLMIMEPQSDRYWHDICSALGIEQLENDVRFESAQVRRENCTELVSILDGVFAGRTRDEWLAQFSPYDFVYAPIYDFADVVDEPQVIENEYIVNYDHPTLGKTRVVGFPVRLTKTPARIRSVAPEFGQHTEEVLLDVGGYSWDEIAELKEQGII